MRCGAARACAWLAKIVCMNIYKYAYMYIYICIYVYIYMYIYIYVHIYMYIYRTDELAATVQPLSCLSRIEESDLTQ